MLHQPGAAAKFLTALVFIKSHTQEIAAISTGQHHGPKGEYHEGRFCCGRKCPNHDDNDDVSPYLMIVALE